jgi:hypothetical protein
MTKSKKVSRREENKKSKRKIHRKRYVERVNASKNKRGKKIKQQKENQKGTVLNLNVKSFHFQRFKVVPYLICKQSRLDQRESLKRTSAGQLATQGTGAFRWAGLMSPRLHD